MVKEETFEITIKGPGMDIQWRVSEHVAKTLVSVAMGADAPPGPPRDVPTTTTDVPGTSVEGSPREFIDRTQARTVPEKITALGMYARDARGAAGFKSDELRALFEEAQEPVPTHLARDLGKTVKASWIAPKSGKKDEYYVTATGANAARSKFPTEVRVRSRAQRKRRSSAKRTSSRK